MTEHAIRSLSGPEAGPASGQQARHLVVLLHGWGANGEDLFGLVPSLQQVLPDAYFAAPNGPDNCDAAPPGTPSYQWFSLNERSPQAMFKGVEKIRPSFDSWLSGKLTELSLDESSLALIGFSQGAMLALHAALRRPRPVVAVVGYSGLLIAPDRLADEMKSKPPVLLIHGDGDPVVPFSMMAAAESALTANNVPVESMARPGLGHGIDGPGLARAAEFLRAKLGS